MNSSSRLAELAFLRGRGYQMKKLFIAAMLTENKTAGVPHWSRGGRPL